MWRFPSELKTTLGLVLLLTVSGNDLVSAQEEATSPKTTNYTNVNPQFDLTLPERYTPVKSQNSALLVFMTKDNPDTIVGVYGLGRTLAQETNPRVSSTIPGTRQFTTNWKGFPVTVIASYKTGTDGSKSAARWVQIPLKKQAVSITVLTSAENDLLADQVLSDFLSGLDGASNWRAPRVISPTEQAIYAALGSGLAFILIAASIFVVRVLRRRQTRTSATTIELPPTDIARQLKSSAYWLWVCGVVFGLITAIIAYMMLVALSLSLIFNLGFLQSLSWSFATLEISVIVAQVFTLLSWFSIIRRHGSVMIDIGPNPLRKLYLSIGTLSVVVAVASGVSVLMLWNRTEWMMVFLPVMQLVIGVQFLVRGMSRFDAAGNGTESEPEYLPTNPDVTRKFLFGFVLLAALAFDCGPVRAEKVSERREQADYVLSGPVTAIYERETSGAREYIVEIKVSEVERGFNVKKGDVFRAYCYKSTETRAIPHASGHSKVPKEGDQVTIFVKRAGGRNTGIYKNWIDITSSSQN